MSNMKKETGKETQEDNRLRETRKKVYERPKNATIPDGVIQAFRQKGYDLKPVRWTVNGTPELRYLHRREQEGYEFVTQDELPDWFKAATYVTNTSLRQGLVTMGDLCLMKIPTELRESRREVFLTDAEAEINAVNTRVRSSGLRDLGSRSQVYRGRSPSFQA